MFISDVFCCLVVSDKRVNSIPLIHSWVEEKSAISCIIKKKIDAFSLIFFGGAEGSLISAYIHNGCWVMAKLLSMHARLLCTCYLSHNALHSKLLLSATAAVDGFSRQNYSSNPSKLLLDLGKLASLVPYLSDNNNTYFLELLWTLNEILSVKLATVSGIQWVFYWYYLLLWLFLKCIVFCFSALWTLNTILLLSGSCPSLALWVFHLLSSTSLFRCLSSFISQGGLVLTSDLRRMLSMVSVKAFVIISLLSLCRCQQSSNFS